MSGRGFDCSMTIACRHLRSFPVSIIPKSADTSSSSITVVSRTSRFTSAICNMKLHHLGREPRKRNGRAYPSFETALTAQTKLLFSLLIYAFQKAAFDQLPNKTVIKEVSRIGGLRSG